MFLRGFEAQLIKRDFKDFLRSVETTTIEIRYKVASGAVTENEAYNVTTAAAWLDKFIPVKASQKIIQPTDERILAWGILRSGDCLFYIYDEVDLSNIDYNSAYIKCNDQEWQPVPIDNKHLLDYLGFRLGNDQVAQIIPCRTKQ